MRFFLLFFLVFLTGAHAFACQQDEEPDPISVFWSKENTVEISLINRAANEDNPIYFVVNIDGKETRKLGPYQTRYAVHVDLKLEGLSPSAHTFTFRSISGKTGCQSDETPVKKLESWYEHTHQPDLSEGLWTPFMNSPSPPPN